MIVANISFVILERFEQESHISVQEQKSQKCRRSEKASLSEKQRIKDKA